MEAGNGLPGLPGARGCGGAAQGPRRNVAPTERSAHSSERPAGLLQCLATWCRMISLVAEPAGVSRGPEKTDRSVAEPWSWRHL